MSDPFSVPKRIQSFRYAIRGLVLVARTQHNSWIHAFASALVVFAGFALRVSAGDWCWLVLAMMAVWASEAFNTALEQLADAAVPETHPLIQGAKDAAAAAVLVSAIGAALIGVLVLGPHLLHWIR